MHQDFVDKNECKVYVNEEQVCELFNFNFDISMKMMDDGKLEMDGRIQLVLSQDTKKLMVIFENNLFTIYNRGDLIDGEKEIEWKPD